MNTIEPARKLGPQRVRRLASALVLSTGAAFRTSLRPGLRRRLAAAGASAALAFSTLLTAQPAAADTAYPVYVTFDNVKFTMVNDGCPNQYSTIFCGVDGEF